VAPAARTPRRLKLLLDTHHSPVVAETLRADGHDVLAAAVVPTLARLEDDDLLRAAVEDDRAVVTENAKDFDRIVRAWSARGDHHVGIVFTSPRRYHRGSSAYPGILIAALRQLLADPPTEAGDWVHWLP